VYKFIYLLTYNNVTVTVTCQDAFNWRRQSSTAEHSTENWDFFTEERNI